MSTTYKIVSGDTFESIARKKYGSELQAEAVARANPGVSEPLTAGRALSIPLLPYAPKNQPQATRAENKEEIAILIDGKRFRFWDRVRITRAMDKADTVEFGAPFEPDNTEFREKFRPFSFKPVVVTMGGAALFTGTLIGVTPVLDNARNTISVSAYSLPGILNDCTAPASSYPIEFNGQKLNDIATTMAAPFGIAVEFKDDAGAVFPRVAAEPGDKVLEFWEKLAKQRNLVIGTTPAGAALFWKSVEPGSPVATLRQGSSPVLSVTPFFNPQEYYSHVTGIEPVEAGSGGSQFTVKNTLLEGITRPMTFNTPDTEGGGVKAVVEAKAGRMFGNMAAYAVRVAGLHDSQGKLWSPNTTIKLIAPRAMIYREYEFVIRSVVMDVGMKSQFSTLNLVMPGAFSGQLPESLPWDG